MVTMEQVLDMVADKIMLNINQFTDNPQATLQENSKTIRDGLIRVGLQNEEEKLLLFQNDVEANEADILANVNYGGDETPFATSLSSLVDYINNYLQLSEDDGTTLASIGEITLSNNALPELPQIDLKISGVPGSPFTISDIIYNETTGNPLNVGQFIGLSNVKSNINSDLADEYLDKTIFELLPTSITRQQKINTFFRDFQELSGLPPQFIEDQYGDLTPPNQYSEDHDISQAQDGNPDIGINEEESYITRLNITANQDNTGKTLQSLRDSINLYLKDIDQVLEAEIEDLRPEYENKSDGWLKIRNLNQGIIIRKQEGDRIGLEQQVSNNLHIHQSHECHTITGGPSYLCDGFTISMWVRFLDKTSNGTLFNYGNPLRSLDPKGIRLETYILNKNDLMETEYPIPDEEGVDVIINHTWGEVAEYLELDLFQESDSERFVRMVVRDHLDRRENTAGRLYDSHIGMSGNARNHSFVPEFGISYENEPEYNKGSEVYLLNHTRVPLDFDEWFFIVANYNPGIQDNLNELTVADEYKSNPDFWNENIDTVSGNPDNIVYTHYSGHGTKCKVEIISRSDLLRARGYKV